MREKVKPKTEQTGREHMMSKKFAGTTMFKKQ
jgi:hypothetical protein